MEGKISRTHQGIALTHKQEQVLLRLQQFPDGSTIGQISEVIEGSHPYIIKAGVRATLTALARKGLCTKVSTSPVAYRLTVLGESTIRFRAKARPDGHH